MFHEEFFPTPLSLIQKLISPYRESEHGRSGYKVPADWTILEPSAGKGDIADYLADYNEHSYGRKKNEARVKVIEQNFDLQQILMGKGYPIIGHDFLSYQADQHFDLIVMNPPFSNGDAHLLHAWEVVGDGGHIACILNSETVRNPHTKRRQELVSLIDAHGSVEFVGQAFARAERKTGVDTCIVRLQKPKSERDPLEFVFEPADKSESEMDPGMEESVSGALAHIDHLGAIINQYDSTKDAFVNFLRAMEELRFYGSSLANHHSTSMRDIHDRIHCLAMETYRSGGSNKAKCNEFRDGLNMSAWRMVLSKLNVNGIMTSSVAEAFQKNVEKAGHLPLTKANIAAVVGAIIGNSQESMKSCVVEVFDIFTKYHSENRILNQEGWKTNKSWRCTKRVILPNWVDARWSSGMCINHSRSRQYADIDKACCWLMGKNYDGIVTIEKAMTEDMNGAREQKGQSEFFKFRYFKKGTVHLEFKGQDLLDKFNKIANENKNWLGDGT